MNETDALAVLLQIGNSQLALLKVMDARLAAIQAAIAPIVEKPCRNRMGAMACVKEDGHNPPCVVQLIK